MDLKQRLKSDKETHFGNIIYKPWFEKFIKVALVIWFVIMAFVLYPYLRPASLEDCADLEFINLPHWKVDKSFIETEIAKKLKIRDYELSWEICEKEKQQTPEKFKIKYKNARKIIDKRFSNKK
jgi:hypothetical protein